MSRSKVKAGEGYVEIGLRNRIAQGAAGIQNDLNKFGKNITQLGATIAASSAGLLAFPLKAASEMQETMSKFQVVFAESAGEVEKWSDTTAKAVGVSRESMLGMLAGMQDLLVPMGVMPGQATEMSKTLSALAVDLGSFNNMRTEEVFANLMSAITGEGQVMKKYGVILTETATKQELLNMGMAPSTADNAAKAQARLNIIMRGTTAAQGDAIRTADSFANVMKRIWASVTDVTSLIGGPFIEDLAAMGKAASAGVSAFGNLLERNKDLVRVLGLATVAAGGLGAGLIAAGIAAKLAASSMAVVGVAAKTAATVAAVAWAGVSVAFTVLTIKSRISAAIISTAYSVASKVAAAAWTAASGIISVAMQGLIGVVTAAAMAAPWIAGAGLIAVAWFGLDAVLGALAIAASGAWAASAAFIGSAWATLAGVLAGVGITGAASAAMASTAWSAFGALGAIIAAEQTLAAGIVSAAWTVASAVSSVAWAGFTAVLSAALTPASLMAGAAFLVSGAWSVAAGIASAAWAAAWAVITGPLLPFIAVGAAVTAMVVGMGAALASLAIKAIDFGSAFGKAKSMLDGIVGVITDVFDTLKLALNAGDYAAAAEALWVGIRLGFWNGVAGAMDAFKWLWTQAGLTAQRFFMDLLNKTKTSMSAIAEAITNPFRAGARIGVAVREIVGSSVSFDVSDQAERAREDLKNLRDELAAQNAKDPNSAGGDPADGEPGDSGGGAGNDDNDAFLDKARAIEIEIAALEKGEQAADRMRLADEGLNDTEIKAIELLKAKKKALEDAAEAQKKAARQRADNIFDRGEEFADRGMAPGEIFNRVMAQIGSDQRAGTLDKDTADEARERARGNLDQRVDAIKAEGKALADALRTPAEILNDKLANISRLQDQGAISDTTAERAEDQARKEFREEQERNKEKAAKTDAGLEQEQRRTGPSASFSASAAAIIGMGGTRETAELKAMRETAKNTALIAKQNKKKQIARFG